MNLSAPENYAFNARDGVENRLTRYRGGPKGPVMVAHGAAVWSGMFSLPTIDENFTSYLAKNGYDVWLLDWRASIKLPLRQFTLDDPAAITLLEKMKSVAALQTARCTCDYRYGYSDHAEHCQSIHVAKYDGGCLDDD